MIVTTTEYQEVKQADKFDGLEFPAGQISEDELIVKL